MVWGIPYHYTASTYLVSHKYEESQGDFLKDVSKISKKPWPNTSQNTRVLQRQLDSALAEREQKFGREVSVTTCQVGFLPAHLTKPDYIFQHLESPGLTRMTCCQDRHALKFRSVCFYGLFHLRFKNIEHLAKHHYLFLPHFMVVQCAHGRLYDVLPKTLKFNAWTKMIVQKHSFQFSFSNFHFWPFPEYIIKVKII